MADSNDASPETRSPGTPEVNTSIWSNSGRLGVLKYMSHYLILVLVLGALLLVVLGLNDFISPDAAGPLSPLLTAILVAVCLPLLWVGIALFVRRLHDLNQSGWLALVLLIPVVGAFFSLLVGLCPGNKTINNYGSPVVAAPWEKVLGGIGVVVAIGFVLTAIVRLVAPSWFWLAVSMLTS